MRALKVDIKFDYVIMAAADGIGNRAAALMLLTNCRVFDKI